MTSWKKFFLISGFLSLSACGKVGPFGAVVTQNVDLPSVGQSTPTTTAPMPTTLPAVAYEPLVWENKPARKVWSDYIFQVIQTDAVNLIAGADDIARFCPAYANLTINQKVNFWGQLMAAVSKYESAFDPLSRYQETTMGTDPITGQPVYSEGLLQLSYQDIQPYPFCEFDWNNDKNLSPTDPHKTILDPYKNLRCGTRIMAEQIQRHHKIAVSSGAYWSTLKDGGSYQVIDSIATLTKNLSFCH